MTTHLPQATATAVRWLAETAASDPYHNSTDSSSHGDEHGEFGVHITYEDLYDTMLFLTAIYVAGQVASRLLKMPCLVGEIVAGILLGPPLANFVPNPEAWVLLGEIGLILLVIEAGIDIDVSTLKLIGTRGCLIAVVGSILPIGIGIALAFAVGTSDVRAAIAAGATFGPTSLGIALNILRSGGVLNTPVGQMIVSAAVIDDMIALIVLSQLEALVGTITVAGILIPVISALLYLVIGGLIALYVFPPLLEKYVLSKIDADKIDKGKLELAVMFVIVLIMMPATHYAKASYLMGAFIAGLAFCTSHELHSAFVRQFKRVLQWLMRIFFAASIGFQVPVTHFGSGTVLWRGFVFCLALIGKLAVGFMVPNFTQSGRFRGFHLRDCLVTGFSMAAEGEFAFVIAVFSVDNGLIDQDLYASVVLAVLISTIIPPFLLRFTITYYNKRAEAEVQKLADEEMKRNHDLEALTDPSSEPDRETELIGDIRSKTAVFLCIQTRSMSKWGLLHKMLGKLAQLGLDIIDHRSWHPRGLNTTLVTEVYVRDRIEIAKGKGESQEILEKRIAEIREALEKTIDQPDDASVQVTRWFPGVVQEIVESVDHQAKKKNVKKKLNLEQRLLEEAESNLTRKERLQTAATKEKTVEEILASMQQSPVLPELEEGGKPAETSEEAAKKRRVRKRRQKMRSTPVVGGGLFGETDSDTESTHEDSSQIIPASKKGVKDLFPSRGIRAEIIVDGESYNIRISNETLKQLRAGFSGDMLDSRGVSVHGIQIEPDAGAVVNRLQGYVRNAPLSKIVEEPDSESETSSMADSSRHKVA